MEILSQYKNPNGPENKLHFLHAKCFIIFSLVSCTHFHEIHLLSACVDLLPRREPYPESPARSQPLHNHSRLSVIKPESRLLRETF